MPLLPVSYTHAFLGLFAVQFGALLAFAMLGWGLLRLLAPSFLRQQHLFGGIFWCMLAGITAATTVYALALTGGRSVQLALLPLALLLWWFSRLVPKAAAVQAEPSSYPAYQIVLAAGVLAIAGAAGSSYGLAYLYHQNAEGLLELARPFNDLMVYARHTASFPLTGEENFYHYHNLLDPEFRGPVPYHWVEMWLASLVSAVAGIPAIIAFQGVAVPLLIAVFAFGGLALAQRGGWPAMLASVALLALPGHYPDLFASLPILENGPVFRDSTPLLGGYGAKVLASGLLMIGTVLLWRQGRYLAGVVLLAAIPVFSFGYLPAAAAGIGTVLAAGWFFGGKIGVSRKEVQLGAAAAAVALAGVLGFYAMLGNSVIPFIRPNFGLYLSQPALLLKTAAIVVKLPMMIAAVMGVWLLLLALLVVGLRRRWTAQYTLLLLWGLGSCAGGLLFTALVYPASIVKFNDSAQFILLVYPLVLWLLAVVLLADWLAGASSHRVKQSLTGALSAVAIAVLVLPFFRIAAHGATLYSCYSESYVSTVAQLVQLPLPRIGAYITNREDMNADGSPITFNYLANHYFGWYLAYLPGQFTAISISDLDVQRHPLPVPAIARIDSVLIQSSGFWRYAQHQKQQGVFESIPASQVQFLRQHNIRFVIVSRTAAIPDTLLHYKDAVVTDPVSGERFLVLRPWEQMP